MRPLDKGTVMSSGSYLLIDVYDKLSSDYYRAPPCFYPGLSVFKRDFGSLLKDGAISSDRTVVKCIAIWNVTQGLYVLPDGGYDMFEFLKEDLDA